jgi:drug/metabolite transporter (DMT)-like permease
MVEHWRDRKARVMEMDKKVLRLHMLFIVFMFGGAAFVLLAYISDGERRILSAIVAVPFVLVGCLAGVMAAFLNDILKRLSQLEGDQKTAISSAKEPEPEPSPGADRPHG